MLNKLMKDYPKLKESIGVKGKKDVGFLVKLQHIHDNYEVEAWSDFLVLFADEYSLVSGIKDN